MGIASHLNQRLFLRLFTILACVVLVFSFTPQFAYSEVPQKTKQAISENETSSVIYNFSLRLGGWLVYGGGMIFDGAINKMVLRMGCWFVEAGPITAECGTGFSNGSVGGVVNALWMVIRDIFNILFIFSLIFIGLKIIWNANDSGTKRALGLLIAAALLINFSLYITKVIVDMSNFAAIAIHSVATGQIKSDDGDGFVIEVTPEGEDSFFVANFPDHSISAGYMQVLNISSWFAEDVTAGSVTKVMIFSIILLLFLLILAATLAWGGILLITRFIALIIFMIFSPIMFLGWVLPQFASYSSKWWSMFLSYAFFAPAYIFMLYLGLYTLVQMRGAFPGNFADGVASGGVDSFSIFMFFAIGIGFLIAATKVGQMMGVAGAGAAMSTMKGVNNKIQGGARWGAGYAASAGAGWAARSAGAAMDKRSAASDKPRSRWAQSRRNLVMMGETSKFGGSKSSKERVDSDTTEAKRHSVASRAHGAQQSVLNATTAIDRETAVAKADAPVLIEMLETEKGRKVLYNNAGSVSDEKMKEIMKSDDVAPEVKKMMTEKKKAQVSENLIEEHKSGDAIGDVLNKASVSELKTIGFDTAHENASSLTSKQIEDWEDLTPTQKRSLKKKRSDDLISAFETPTGPKAIFTHFKNDTERSKLPKEILSNTDSVEYLNKNILTKLVDNDGIEDGDRRIIRKNIENHFPSSTAEGREWRKWFNRNNAGQRYPS